MLAAIERCQAQVIKLEDPPTPPKITQLLAARPQLEVFGGLGGVAALMELTRGAAGLMTGFTVPEILRAIYDAWAAGDRERAGATFDRYLPLIALEGQIGIGLGIRKEILKRRGVIRSAAVRLAAGHIDDVTRKELGEFVSRAGLSLHAGRLAIT